MRLLQLQVDGGFSLVERIGENIPEYAVLSHTWGADKDEVTFRDLVEGTGEHKAGYKKLTFCRDQAAKNGLQFFWVDTCCIDKSSSAELAEAINSMFRWYQNANQCYAYLSDVSSADSPTSSQSLQNSRWFTRGWTLQELLAPRDVQFFSQEGLLLGDKASLMPQLTQITGIPIEALEGSKSLADFSVRERMSWMGIRQTKREEDAVYCLLGIFNIYMLPIYGEGRDNALSRLYREMNRPLPDSFSTAASKWREKELSKRDISQSMPVSHRLNSESMESLDISSLIEAFTEALELDEHYNDFQSLSYQAIGNSESKSRQTKARVNILEGLDENKGDIKDIQIEIKDREAVTKETISHPLHDISSNESDSYAEAIFGQVDFFQNKTNHSTAQVTHFFQMFFEECMKDTTIHRPAGLANILDISRFLVDVKKRQELSSLKNAHDWLDVTKFNDRNDIAPYYDKQVSTCLEGTCRWIFEHSAYHEWVSERHANRTRILWICGPAGYGKTVLCAQLVERLKTGPSPVVYFFASPHAQSGGDTSFIIRSWVAQMAQLDPDVLEVIRPYSMTGQRASEPTVWSLFKTILSTPRNYTFVLDALDEYSRADDARSRFLQRLKNATDQSGSRIVITSRIETDIEAELHQNIDDGLGHVALQCRISDQDVRDDITLFSRSVVDEKLPKKPEKLREELAQQLSAKCEGMFLWIKLQKDQLRSGKNAKNLHSIVAQMPLGLLSTYERNWKSIQDRSSEDRKRALAILEWTTYALQPLSVAEITEALIVEYDEDAATVQWDELPDDIDEDYINTEIIEICEGLVEAREEKSESIPEMRTVRLIHQSVREFLLHTLPLGGAESYLRLSNSLNPATQHEHLATVCLIFLCDEDTWKKRESPDESRSRPSFFEYAARNWPVHVASAGEDRARLMQMVTNFLQPSNKNFSLWSDYFETLEETSVNDEKSPKTRGTPLYYASLFDLPKAIEHILAQDATQLNQVGGMYGTPLQAACFKGHESITNLLLDRGADPNVQGGEFGIPLNAAISEGNGSIVKTLLDKGSDLTIRDHLERTPLCCAVLEGNYEMVCWILAAGADPNGPDMTGLTPLNLAAINNHFAILKLLLEKGADIDSGDANNCTSLVFAAYKGNLEIVKLLLEEGADLAKASKDGTPLLTAVVQNHIDICKLLLEKGSDINAACNDVNWAPLHSASYRGLLEAVELLLEEGADISAVDIKKWTPLHLAASSGHFEVSKLLLDKGPDINAVNTYKWTPLHLAVYHGHFEVSKLLLESGADMSATDNDGLTPLQSAISRGHLEVVKLLVEMGADTAAVNNLGWTPFNVATSHGNIEIVKLLLEHGADPTMANVVGRTPLISAAANGHVEVVELLLDQGVSLSAAADDGAMPLHAAAERGHLEMVKLLIKRGADTTTPMKKGHTALTLAVREEHFETAKLLLDHGSDVNGFSPLCGSVVNLMAIHGITGLLRLAFEQYNASRELKNLHNQNPLHLAASGGHFDSFLYLKDLNFDLKSQDAKGDGLLPYICSGGSIEILDLFLKDGLGSPFESTNWSLLHWACRSESPEVVKRLIKEGVRSTCVSVPDPEGSWDPISIAMYHKNQKVLDGLSDDEKNYLAGGTDVVRDIGEYRRSFCDSCYCVSHPLVLLEQI